MPSLDLNLSTVELTSTLRTAPLNGAPSSADYNDSQRENLVDLATVVSFINNQLLPLINALPASSLLPTVSPVGIEGRTVWTDTSDQSSLFFNPLASLPLSIADSIRVLNGIIITNSQQLIDLGVEVSSLQARLASTNQNDIALALQNLSSSLNQLIVTQNTQGTSLSSLQILLNNEITRAEASETLRITHSAGPLTAFHLMIGNGSGDANVISDLGTTHTVLHGNALGFPSFGPVVEADQLLSNVTTNNVSVLAHGYVPILPNNSAMFLNGSGTWTIPAGTGGGSGGGAYATSIGDGSSLSFVVNHNLNTADVIVGTHDVSTGELSIADIDILDNNNVLVSFGVAPEVASERVIVLSSGGSIASSSSAESVQAFGVSAPIGFAGGLNTLVEATAGTFGIVLTLPDATTCAGQVVRIIQMDTGLGVTISTLFSQAINNVFSIELTNQYQTVSLESNGANWIIIASAG